MVNSPVLRQVEKRSASPLKKGNAPHSKTRKSRSKARRRERAWATAKEPCAP